MPSSCSSCRAKDEKIAWLEKRLARALDCIERHRAKQETTKVPLPPEKDVSKTR